MSRPDPSYRTVRATWGSASVTRRRPTGDRAPTRPRGVVTFDTTGPTDRRGLAASHRAYRWRTRAGSCGGHLLVAAALSTATAVVFLPIWVAAAITAGHRQNSAAEGPLVGPTRASSVGSIARARMRCRTHRLSVAHRDRRRFDLTSASSSRTCCGSAASPRDPAPAGATNGPVGTSAAPSVEDQLGGWSSPGQPWLITSCGLPRGVPS